MKTNNHFTVVVLIALHFSINAIAQNDTIQPVQIINLQQAIQLAQEKYPSIKAKQASLKSSLLGIKETRTEYIPEIITQNQVLYGTSNGVRGAYFAAEGSAIPVSGGIQPDQNWTPVFGSFSTLMLDWKLFSFGKIKSKIAVSKAENLMAEADLTNEIFQHQIKVIDAYLLYLISKKMILVQESYLKRAKIFQKSTFASVKSGLKAGVDSSFANAEFTKAEILLLESQKNNQLYKNKLAELLGVSETKTFEIDTAVFYTKIPAKKSEGEQNIKNNTILKLYEQNIAINKAKIKAINRSYYPTIGLMVVGWARGTGVQNKTNSDGSFVFDESPSAGLAFKAYNYMVNLHFRWVISNYFKTNAQSQRQLSKTNEVQFLYDEQMLKLSNTQQSALLQFKTATEQSLKAPLQLKYAQNAYLQSESRYKTGLISLLDLVQSFYTLNRSELDVIIATNNVWRALLMHAAASGDISIFTSQVF